MMAEVGDNHIKTHEVTKANVVNPKDDDNTSSSKPDDDVAVAAKKIIASDGGTEFINICLYNSLHLNSSASAGISRLNDIYANLMGLHGFMAGFQYIALDEEVVSEGDEKNQVTLKNIIFILRYSGFMISLLGTILCLIIQEYLKTIEDEDMLAQVRGILKYRRLIKLGDITAIGAVAILTITSNLLLYTKDISTTICIVFNAITAFGALLFLRAFYVVLLRRQTTGRHIYMDPDFQEAQNELKKKSFFSSFLENMNIRKSFLY